MSEQPGLVNLTNINQQDVVRNTNFSITKEFTFMPSVEFITGFSATPFDNVTITLLANDVEINPTVLNPMGLTMGNTSVGINHSTTTFKLKLEGSYDALYNQDLIKYVSAGSSDLIETPTQITGFNNLPSDAEIISVAQDPRDNLSASHTVVFSLTYNAGLDATATKTFSHQGVRTDNEGFRKAIQQHVSRRMTPFTNPNAIASGKSKLLGNITDGNINTINNTGEFPPTFPQYWNSAIAGNVCKWRPVEGTQGNFDFSGADVLHAFCKNNGLKFIWHTLLWGANQGHPEWFEGLNEEDSKAAVKAWFKAVADRYGDDIYGIQVLNEITPGHQSKTETVLKAQLGGAGATGFDWAIWVYEQARFYFPNALLWTNDFGLLNNTTNASDNRRFMYEFSNVLSDRGLVDAFGMQSHYFNINDLTAEEVQFVLDEVQANVNVPIHITEFDLSGNDAEQLARYQRIFPVIWNHPRVERVNLWGWITGETWRHDQGHVTGLIDRDGENKRPALTWLESFVKGTTFKAEVLRFKSDFNSSTNNYPDGLVNNLSTGPGGSMSFRVSNVGNILPPWDSIPSEYTKIYSANLNAGITAHGPQFAIYTNNASYSNSPNTYQSHPDLAIDFTYFVPRGHPCVGLYWHIGAANNADPEDAPSTLDYKDFYSPYGVQIVGGEWTTARLFAGSKYGGLDLNGTQRFLTITNQRVFSPTMQRITYTGVETAGDITNAEAVKQMIFIAGYSIFDVYT